MPSCFGATPRLSTICCLDDVVPHDHDGSRDWSGDAKTAFVNMTSTRPMKMKVTHTHMHTFLCVIDAADRRLLLADEAMRVYPFQC